VSIYMFFRKVSVMNANPNIQNTVEQLHVITSYAVEVHTVLHRITLLSAAGVST
jgi:hypothetical protein